MHAVSDHIVCDPASRSELVVPLVVTGRLWGVLDLDSPRPSRFSIDDQVLVEALCARFIEASDFAGSAAGF